jgi:anaerobic ribonucleoside-triphosphate reductase
MPEPNPDPAVQLAPDERQPCEVWTRVMGYHRPVSQFNAGKKSEHRERTHFRECRAPLTD